VNDLEVTVGPVDAGAGQRYVPVVFRNTSSVPCTLEGYPLVVAADAAGTPLAVAGHEEAAGPATVALGPGDTASALVHAVAVPSGDTECPPDAAALLVAPPGSAAFVSVSVSLPTCPGLRVRAVVPGESGQPTG
jgi:hypothetical protein